MPTVPPPSASAHTLRQIAMRSLLAAERRQQAAACRNLAAVALSARRRDEARHWRDRARQAQAEADQAQAGHPTQSGPASMIR